MSAEHVPVMSTAGLIITGSFGLLTAVVTGVLANWNKIFRRDRIVQAKVVGYSPTGNFETEMRYFIEVSGMRATISDVTDRFLEAQEQRVRDAFPEDSQEIEKNFEIIRECSPSLEDFLAVLIPIWKKYYTLNEIQELNRFYSTKPMQDFISKSRYITEEYMPKMLAIVGECQARSEQRMAAEVLYQPRPGGK